LCLNGCLCSRDRIIKIFGSDIYLFQLQTPLDTPWVDFDENAYTAVESNGLWLSPTHFAQSGTENKFAAKIAPAMLTSKRAKSFVCSLQNALRPDVDPGTSGHLAVHHQTFAFVLIELLLCGPVRNDV